MWQGIPRHLGRKEKERGRYETARAIDWATGCGVLLNVLLCRTPACSTRKFSPTPRTLIFPCACESLGWQIRYAPAAKLWHKEGFATRRNAGEHVRYFTSTRNILWVMHKHARALQWVTFFPYFLARYVLVILLMSLYRGDLKSARATLDGIVAFFRMRDHPDSAVLPEELMQTTLPPVEGGLHPSRTTTDADSALLRQPPA